MSVHERIKAKNTAPELKTRQLLRDMGYKRYRIHYSELPGKPDIAFSKLRKAIFVHGCFWHSHRCKYGAIPKTNMQYWIPKLKRNRDRDSKHIRKIRSIGWKVLVLWECQLKDSTKAREILTRFLKSA